MIFQNLGNCLLRSLAFTLTLIACCERSTPPAANSQAVAAVSATQSEGAIPRPGYLRSLNTQALTDATQWCTADVASELLYEVSLDQRSKVTQVRIRRGTGNGDCDKSLTTALAKSTWQTCRRGERSVSCTVAGKLAL